MKTFTSSMVAVAAAAALLFAGDAAAFFRMPCRGRTGLGRIDPLVHKGLVAPHVHTFQGSGNMGFDVTYDDLASDDACTSCQVTKDKSAYWTPVMYFLYENGTSVAVSQVGGMLVYYLMYLDDIEPFPEGFSMTAGNPTARNFSGPFPDEPLSSWPQDPSGSEQQAWLEQRAVGFNCLNYEEDPEGSLYRHEMPSKEYLDAHCADGVRIELAFPSCGTGDKDSNDHKSHMAYPSLVKQGNCPTGYDVHYPYIFFETIWATNEFQGEDGQFVLAMGDPVGTGYHGDFMMGWESSEFLSEVIQECGASDGSGNVEDCSVLSPHIQSSDAMNKCTFTSPKEIENDDCEGPREGLPVDVPVQSGPEDATAYPVAGRSGVASSTAAPEASSSAAYSQAPASSYSSVDAASSTAAQDSSTAAIDASSTAAHDTIAAVYQAPSAVDSAQSSTLVAVQKPADSAVTPAPPPPPPPSPPQPEECDDDEPNSYTTFTRGNTVVVLQVEKVHVTVTKTTTATSVAAAMEKHQRHLHRHNHPNRWS